MLEACWRDGLRAKHWRGECRIQSLRIRGFFRQGSDLFNRLQSSGVVSLREALPSLITGGSSFKG